MPASRAQRAIAAGSRGSRSAVAIGVDGCPGGWIAAILTAGVPQWQWAPVGDLAGLLRDHLPEAGSALAIDMPIGLVEQGWRACDLQAKATLGRDHARVFLTPPRAVVDLGPTTPNAEVQQRCRSLTGAGISRQALALAPRILEVDACLPDPRIIEAHPELSFAAMAGRVLASKHTGDGVTERIDALAASLPETTEVGDISDLLARRPARVPVVDALDALAVAWTAQRHLRGQSQATPPDPPVDSRGVAMAIFT